MNPITTNMPKFPAKKGNLAIVTQGESCPFRSLIDEWLESCRADGLSQKTISDYRGVAYKFWWWWDHNYAATLGVHPKNVTTTHCRAFAAYLRSPVAFRWGEKVVRGCQTLSAASVASYGRSAKVFFSWLERESHIDQSPFNKSVKFTQRHKQEKLIKTVEQDDLNRIFLSLTQPDYLATYHGARNLAMVALLLDSGMRRGELLNLRLCDVNLDKNTCLVRGKTGERWTFFNEVCHDALRRYLDLHRLAQEPLIANQNAPLWLTEDGHPFGYESMSNITRQIERVSGVKFHLHSLRHTFATWMINRTDVYTVQRFLGHSSIKTTEVYLHQNKAGLEAHYRPNSPLDSLAGEQSGLKRRRGRPRKQ